MIQTRISSTYGLENKPNNDEVALTVFRRTQANAPDAPAPM